MFYAYIRTKTGEYAIVSCTKAYLAVNEVVLCRDDEKLTYDIEGLREVEVRSARTDRVVLYHLWPM